MIKRKGQCRLVATLTLFLFFGDPAAIRTQDLLLRRQLLYPAELRGLGLALVGMPRFELGVSCSQSRRDNRTTLHPAYKSLKKRLFGRFFGGEGGIRTPGTLIEYDSLANCWFQPLTHLSVAMLNCCVRRPDTVSFLIEIVCKSTNFSHSDQIFFAFYSKKI